MSEPGTAGNGRERPGTGILRPLGITPDTQELTPGAGTAGNGPERLALLARDWPRASNSG